MYVCILKTSETCNTKYFFEDKKKPQLPEDMRKCPHFCNTLAALSIYCKSHFEVNRNCKSTNKNTTKKNIYILTLYIHISQKYNIECVQSRSIRRKYKLDDGRSQGRTELQRWLFIMIVTCPTFRQQYSIYLKQW